MNAVRSHVADFQHPARQEFILRVQVVLVGYRRHIVLLKRLKESALVANTIFLVSICVVVIGTFLGSFNPTNAQSVIVVGFGLIVICCATAGAMFISRISGVMKYSSRNHPSDRMGKTLLSSDLRLSSSTAPVSVATDKSSGSKSSNSSEFFQTNS